MKLETTHVLLLYGLTALTFFVIVTVVDMVWGAFLTASTAATALWLVHKVLKLN